MSKNIEKTPVSLVTTADSAPESAETAPEPSADETALALLVARAATPGGLTGANLAEMARLSALVGESRAKAERAAALAGIPKALTEALSVFAAYADIQITVGVCDGKWSVSAVERPETAPVANTGRIRSGGGGRSPFFGPDGIVFGHISNSETAIRARKLMASGNYTLAQVAEITQPNAPTNIAMCAQNVGTKPVQEALKAGKLDPVTLARIE